jgi:hypothetical protein
MSVKSGMLHTGNIRVGDLDNYRCLYYGSIPIEKISVFDDFAYTKIKELYREAIRMSDSEFKKKYPQLFI